MEGKDYVIYRYLSGMSGGNRMGFTLNKEVAMLGEIRMDGSEADNEPQEPGGITERQLGNELANWQELEEALDQFEEFFRNGFPAMHPSL